MSDLVGYPVQFPAWLDEIFPPRRCANCTFARTQLLPAPHVRVTLCQRCERRGVPLPSWERSGSTPRWLPNVPVLRLRPGANGVDTVYVPTWVKELAAQFVERRTPQELVTAAYTITACTTDVRDYLVSLVTMGAPDDMLEEHVLDVMKEHDAMRFLEADTRAWAARRIAERDGVLPSYTDIKGSWKT
jgi:hypothetical protein